MSPLPFDLNDLYFFAVVVDHRGFTAAAAAIGVPKSRLSRHIADLEKSVGTRLLQRNTRRLELTDAGREFHAHCTALVAQANVASVAMQRRSVEAVGTVRLSVTVAVADWLLGDALPRFMSAHPKVRVTVQATNRLVDLLQENIDLAIRGMKADPESSDIVQASICSVRWGLFASLEYLKQLGHLEDPGRLGQCEALMYRSLDEIDPTWHLMDQVGAGQMYRPAVRLQSDSLIVIKRAALAGLGIAELPLYSCRGEIENGTLHAIFPHLRPRHGRLAILFPSRSGLSPAVRQLVDFLKVELPLSLRPEEMMRDLPLAGAQTGVPLNAPGDTP